MEEYILSSYPFHKVSFLKELLKKDNIWFNKLKSQNFLIDKNYIKKIYNILQEYEGRKFLEIGGGSGNVSIVLVLIAKELAIVELDKYFSKLLFKIFCESALNIEDKIKNYNNLNDNKIERNYDNSKNQNAYDFNFLMNSEKDSLKKISEYILNKSKKIYVFNEDFLSFDLYKFYNEEKLIIFGNIPYNISTKIIMKIVEFKDIIDFAFLTTQKEYFERLLGKFEKSFFTIYTQYHFELNKFFDIPSNAFFPKPEVNSTFFSLKPKKKNYDKDIEKEFFEFVSKSFSNKRKKLLNNFKNDESIYTKLLSIFEKENINKNSRAEEFNLNDFIKIFNHLRSL